MPPSHGLPRRPPVRAPLHVRSRSLCNSFGPIAPVSADRFAPAARNRTSLTVPRRPSCPSLRRSPDTPSRLAAMLPAAVACCAGARKRLEPFDQFLAQPPDGLRSEPEGAQEGARTVSTMDRGLAQSRQPHDFRHSHDPTLPRRHARSHSPDSPWTTRIPPASEASGRRDIGMNIERESGTPHWLEMRVPCTHIEAAKIADMK